MGVESPYEKQKGLRCSFPSAATYYGFFAKVTAPLYNTKGDFFMSEIIITVLKIIAIVVFAMYIGNKTGLFSLGRLTSIIIFMVLGSLLTLGSYFSLVREDISFLIVFKSSFYNFTLDLSFFLRILFATFLVGLICSVFGVKPGLKIKTVKDLCTLAILIAITVLLAVYCTVRIGSGIKVSFKFISVFVTAALFGPIWGGAVGAIADVIAFFVNPVGGTLLPQITLVEFLYGFVFGLFFFNVGSWQNFKTILRVIFCVIIQIVVLNLGLTTYFLMPLMNMSFRALLALRAVSALISMVLYLVVLSFMCKYISSFRRILK